MSHWSSVDVCGMQVNPVDETGLADTTPANVVLTCAANGYQRQAVLTQGLDEAEESGVANRRAMRRFDPPRRDYWRYRFTLNSRTDVRLLTTWGLVNTLFDTVTPTIIVGMEDVDDPALVNDCCPPGEETSVDVETSLLIWHLAWCNEERHPDYLYDVHVVPRFQSYQTTDAVERGRGTRTMTVEGRTRKPKSGYSQGPGSILQAATDRHWSNILTNTPFPDGCDCGDCTQS